MQIVYQKYTFHLTAIDELYLPYYKGSTFRGGFGNAFKKITCVLRTRECGDCPLRRTCTYIYVFETMPSDDLAILNMHKYEKVPTPFVIEPPETDRKTFNPEDNFTFNLILIGKAIDYFPYFLLTFDHLGKIGIGKGRGKYKILKVESNGITVYEDEIFIKTEPSVIDLSKGYENSISTVTLKIVTPLRIKFERRLVDDLEFHVLIRNLLRRLTLLGYFHCNESPDFNAKQLIELAQNVRKTDSSLKWLDWERYSTRQQERMKLGGVVGKVKYEGDIGPFLPYLKAGEILHAGKNTTFGLGRYEISYISPQNLISSK